MFTDLIEQLAAEKGIKIAQMLKDLELGQGTFSTWKKRGSIPSGEIVSKIADYFGVTTDYLLGREETKKAPVSPAVSTDDEELMEYLEELKTRPEMRMLFSLSKNATKEDVEDAVRIIEALRKGRQS